MASLNIELDTLSAEQLTALALIDPTSVKIELTRRKSFSNLPEAMTRLRQAHLNLTNFIEGTRKTQSVRDVIDSGILDTVDRFVATMRHLGMDIGDAPVLQTHGAVSVEVQSISVGGPSDAQT